MSARLIRIACALLLLACAHAGRADAPSQAPLTVFAAASLKESMDAAALDYRRRTGVVVRVAYAGSPSLARQIGHGAPADVFVSADPHWMDHLARTGQLRAGTRRDLLGNALVLIAPRAVPMPVTTLARPASIVHALGDGRLALATTGSVPAGRYARAALESLGLWRAVSRRVVETADVRGALQLVARGEARMGLVYASDAQAEPRVRVLATLPAHSHPRIVYPVAVTARSRHPRAQAFAAWLASPAADAIFLRHGFVPLR